MKFRFEAFDKAGDLVRGEVEATSIHEARDLVRMRGITPFDIRPPRWADLLVQDLSFNRVQRIGDAPLARLARDLATLLQAGLPLDAGLRIASSTAEERQVRDLALKLLDGVLEGAPLGGVMERMGRTFRPEYVRIIQAGDISANLGRAMQELAGLLDRQVEIRAKIRAAMAYPALLVGLAFVSLAIVLGLLVPAVTPIFLENGMPLPGVLSGLGAIREHAGLVLVLGASFLGMMTLAVIVARRRPALRSLLDGMYLSVPVIGPLSRIREAARFTRTLGVLINAGVPPLQALQYACPLVRNAYLRALLEHVVTEVRTGMGIGAAIAQSSALPLVVQHMVAVGEESGRLQEMLMRAAMILERQDQARTAQVLAVLTPAVTIFVSGMIAVIILSVMGAILSLNDLALL